jgi:hypothetical protein
MDGLRRLWLPLLAVSFLIPAQGTEVGEGVIQGVVLGEGRQPVRGAKVHAELKGVPMAKAIRYVETDENGFFLIDQLEFGTYYVAAKKEEEGYGDSGFSFFNDQPVPTALISAQHRFADVLINLGPKAGILTGTINDAATGKPIPAGFWLVQAKDRNKWMGTSAAADFRLLIPSTKEMEVKVSAPGYETWVYPDPAIPSQVLRMDPGSEIHLEIQLKPAHDRSLLVSKFWISEDYIGWLRVEYDVECFPPIPVEDGVRILRFAGSNVLETSSPMKPHVTRERYIKVFDRTVLDAVEKVQTRIEELSQAKEDRRQLELKFGDDGIVESHADDGFEPSSPVKPPFSRQSITGSVVSC